MCSLGIYGEGELRGQPANPGSPGKMAIKMECVQCVIIIEGQMPFLMQKQHSQCNEGKKMQLYKT